MCRPPRPYVAGVLALPARARGARCRSGAPDQGSRAGRTSSAAERGGGAAVSHERTGDGVRGAAPPARPLPRQRRRKPGVRRGAQHPLARSQCYDDGALVENPEFMRYAYHWNFRVRACRPYRAQTKGKVERPIRYLRESFFYGRTFTSDDDLDAQALHWLETEANVRSHATLKERPLDRFERERLLLEPLATRPYHPLVLPPDRSSPGTTSLPAIHVERRPLTAYAQIAGGDR